MSRLVYRYFDIIVWTLRLIAAQFLFIIPNMEMHHHKIKQRNNTAISKNVVINDM